MTRTASITDLDRRIASLAELETKDREEGNESLAEVWRRSREKAQAQRDKMARKEA